MTSPPHRGMPSCPSKVRNASGAAASVSRRMRESAGRTMGGKLLKKGEMGVRVRACTLGCTSGRGRTGHTPEEPRGVETITPSERTTAHVFAVHEHMDGQHAGDGAAPDHHVVGGVPLAMGVPSRRSSHASRRQVRVIIFPARRRSSAGSQPTAESSVRKPT